MIWWMVNLKSIAQFMLSNVFVFSPNKTKRKRNFKNWMFSFETLVDKSTSFYNYLKVFFVGDWWLPDRDVDQQVWMLSFHICFFQTESNKCCILVISVAMIFAWIMKISTWHLISLPRLEAAIFDFDIQITVSFYWTKTRYFVDIRYFFTFRNKFF